MTLEPAKGDRHSFEGDWCGFANALARPDRAQLVPPADILTERRPVPKAKGAYGWYFDELPNVPEGQYYGADQWSLLYVGVAGKTDDSQATLHSRIVGKHLRDADVSTLRLSLGCLLQAQLNLTLELKERTKKTLWFGEEGEDRLTNWMKKHARVRWFESDFPTEIEEAALRIYGDVLPLNIAGNRRNVFRKQLERFRAEMKKKALTGS